MRELLAAGADPLATGDDDLILFQATGTGDPDLVRTDLLSGLLSGRYRYHEPSGTYERS